MKRNVIYILQIFTVPAKDVEKACERLISHTNAVSVSLHFNSHFSNQ